MFLKIQVQSRDRFGYSGGKWQSPSNDGLSLTGGWRHLEQDCQIFLGATYQNGKKYTKWPQNITNGHKIYQTATIYTKWPQNLPNGHNIYQMAT
jgi:hypothetical protein